MTFENFAKLTQSKLLNEPSISSFEQIVFDPKKVKRGDLFVAQNAQDITLALSRDAYAILSDKRFPITDPEIAWLQCENITTTLTSLLRYFLLQRKLHFIYLDMVSATLMQTIVDKDTVIFLDNDAKMNFSKINNAPSDALIIGFDKTYLHNIYPDFQTLDIKISEPIETTKFTLFQSSFRYRQLYYEHIKIPQFFLKKLEHILNFLDNQKIFYDITRCEYIPSFYPLFINKDLQIRNFGTTPLTLIMVEDVTQLSYAVSYLKSKSAWAKHLLFISQENLEKIDLDIPTLTYINLSEIIKLKDIEFNFAIINAKLSDVVHTLQSLQTKEQLSLF